ncbi:hypothetical protein FSP39_007364 [Pinctada imbricata]|uniref:Uncharacterized protein n=1 Tax=Pinctada imbricata TaxID=66713 RepID=A0AA89BYX8_PINIB|nr:hypothetical protein FSP39_007364 [Pinctada imbricata]
MVDYVRAIIKVKSFGNDNFSQSSPLHTTTKTLLTAMKLFGIYHELPLNHVTASTEDVNSEKNPTCVFQFRGKILKIYCAFLSVFLLFNSLRYVAAIFIDDGNKDGLTVLRIVIYGWIINGLLNSISLFVACHKKDRLHKFFECYNKICSDETASEIGLNKKCSRFRRIVATCTIVAMVITVGNAAGFTYLTLSDPKQPIGTVMTNPFGVNFASLALVVLVCLYCTAVWMLPVAFLVSFCIILRYQMKTLRESLEKIVDLGEEKAIRKIIDYRLKHLQLTKLISMLDVDFRYLFGWLHVSGIWTSCFNLYQIINDDSAELLLFTMYITWLVFYQVGVFGTSIAAACLSDEVIHFVIQKSKSFIQEIKSNIVTNY